MQFAEIRNEETLHALKWRKLINGRTSRRRNIFFHVIGTHIINTKVNV